MVVTVVVVVGGGVVVVVMMVVVFSPEFSPPSGSGFLSSEQKKVTGFDYLRKEADVMVDEMGRSARKAQRKTRTSKNRHRHEKQHKSSGAFEEQMLKGEEDS